MTAPPRILRSLVLLVSCVLDGCGGGNGSGSDRVDVPTARPQASVWLTTFDGSQRLQAQAPITLINEADAPTAPGAFVIDVDETTRFQTMRGFGAALTDSSAWLIGTRMSDEQRSVLLRNLFDSQQGVGLSFLRLPMGASDFALTAYTYSDAPGSFSIEHDRAYILPVLKAALALNSDLLVMGTPWSAPAWMKTSGTLNGGSLRPDAYDAFANYFVSFLQAYVQEGVPIESISVVNEPLFESPDYPTMHMTADELIVFLQDHLGPVLAQAGLSPRVFIHDHNWDNPDYPLQVLSDTEAAQHVAGVAFHCYAGDVSAQSRVHDAFPQKEIRLTECTGTTGSQFGPDMVWWMHNLFIGAVRNWATVVAMWNLALDENSGPHLGGCSNCRGVVTVGRDTGTVTYNGEYYALAHASRAARPGATRIESTQVADVVEDVAFLNPDGSKGVLLLNARNEVTAIRIRWSGNLVPYDLPAHAVATITWR